MVDPVLGHVFVARADARPDADSNAFDAAHGICYDAQSARQGGYLYGHMSELGWMGGQFKLSSLILNNIAFYGGKIVGQDFQALRSVKKVGQFRR